MYKTYFSKKAKTLAVFTDKGQGYAFEISDVRVKNVYRKVQYVFLHERGEGPNLTEWPYDLPETLRKYPDMKEVPFHVKAEPADSDSGY